MELTLVERWDMSDDMLGHHVFVAVYDSAEQAEKRTRERLTAEVEAAWVRIRSGAARSVAARGVVTRTVTRMMKDYRFRTIKVNEPSELE